MVNKEYRCAKCQRTFIDTWSVEEAIEEKNINFPNVPNENCVKVCDDCYKRYMNK